jgi:hypothetical protein
MHVSPSQATAPARLLVAECEVKVFRHAIAVLNCKTGAIVREIDNGAGDRALSRQYPHIFCNLRAPYGPTIAHAQPLTRPRRTIADVAKVPAKTGCG